MKELSDKLINILTLRWSPVALKMLRNEEAVPAGVYEPSERLRHCQSIAAAQRGAALYMPARSHACPDGAAIIGIVPMSEKLRSGELYLLFEKLPDIETARKMISTRQEFEPGTYKGTVLAPLAEAEFEPDVVIFTLRPEQVMWLCCAVTYSSGERQVFHTSGYNSTCADLVVNVIKSGQMNVSFGCYGVRAATDLGDHEMYASIPMGILPQIVKALEELAMKSIPESRNKIYMPPFVDKVSVKEEQSAATLYIDEDRCIGCGVCEAFCPENVLVMSEGIAIAQNAEKCCYCYTCAGQCPTRAIRIS